VVDVNAVGVINSILKSTQVFEDVDVVYVMDVKIVLPVDNVGIKSK